MALKNQRRLRFFNKFYFWNFQTEDQPTKRVAQLIDGRVFCKQIFSSKNIPPYFKFDSKPSCLNHLTNLPTVKHSTATRIDVVIPTHEKDLPILEHCISSVKKKLANVGRVIVISKQRYSENAEWFDEALFPFSLASTRDYVGSACGWHFQQLLKFYAPFVIPNISENVLILDSDTVFFRRIKLIDDQGRAFLNIRKDTLACRHDFDQRVNEHAKKVLPSLDCQNLAPELRDVSGINHIMIFNREILRDLFAKVEAHHNNGKKFYEIFLKFSQELHSASEYQIYFLFALLHHPQKVRVKKFAYKNSSDANINKYRFRFKYYYCSFHHYLRGTRCNTTFLEKLKKFVRKILPNF